MKTGIPEVDALSLQAARQLPLAALATAPMARLAIVEWTVLDEHPLFNWHYQTVIYFGDLGLYRCSAIQTAYIPHQRIGPPQ